MSDVGGSWSGANNGQSAFDAQPESVLPDRAFAAVFALVNRYRGRFLFVTVIRVVSSALVALHPYFLAQLVTSVGDSDRALRYLLLLFGTGALHGMLWAVGDFYNGARITPVSYEYKRIAYDTVWSEDYQRFVDRPSGKVASYVNDLRDKFAELYDVAHYGFLPVLSMIPVYVFLLVQSVSLNAVTYLLFLVLAFAVLTRLMKPVDSRQRRLTDVTSSNTGRVFDSYANFVNVFSFRSQLKEIGRNDAQLDEMARADVRFWFALAGYWAMASFLVRGLLWGAVMAYSWWQYDQGNISFVAMVLSITVLIDFTNNYWEVVHFLGQWIDKSASYREAYNYLFPGRNVVAEYDPQRRGFGSGAASSNGHHPAAAIEVRDLSFGYPDDPGRLILQDINFRLERGEKLGIVGRSGEGKSTLIKVLLGFYEPTSGHILVDGRPVGPDELTELQSYVPQDTSLFQETIAYNIGYAVAEQPDRSDIESAAAKANVADFIDSLPAGYETMVGERGVKLSLGQRQRIAIARAFLKQADLIILDEATSSLDSETEARIQSALVDLWRDRSAIIIAHRLATLNDVDRILVIDGGRVVEQGTKDELLAADGLFADLWGLQRAGMLDI
jgi:ATP-binding cassette subfamily B protein